MTVEVHQHPRRESSSAWIVGLLVVVVLGVVLWFVLGRGGGSKRTDVNIDVNVPGQTSGGGNGGNGGNSGR